MVRMTKGVRDIGTSPFGGVRIDQSQSSPS